MTRRGLTLVELVAALALLGLLSAVAVSWTTSAARLSVATGAERRWISAAEESLRLIADDLLAVEPSDEGDDATEDVVARDAELWIAARTIVSNRAGEPQVAVGVVYSFDSSTGRVSRSAGGEPRTLVALVQGLSTEILDIDAGDEGKEDAKMRWLQVRIMGPDGLDVERLYRLPDGVADRDRP